MANQGRGRGSFRDKELASRAGRAGGQASGGNFKNNPQRASEAAKKRWANRE